LKKILVLTALAMVTSLYAANAFAGSHPHDHHGFFIGFNLGGGTADISVPDGEDTDREWGGAGEQRVDSGVGRMTGVRPGRDA